MKVGMTGTQEGLTASQRQSVSAWLAENTGSIEEIHQGDCIGADHAVASWAEMLLIPMVVHPPTFESKRAGTNNFTNVIAVRKPADYLVRNRAIVRATDLLIAVPKGAEVLRSGTWSTVRFARKQGRPVITFWPDGSVTREGESSGT
jgi:hypothetical protein